MKNSLIALLVIISIFFPNYTNAEDGYQLWLRYNRIEDAALLKAYQQSINSYQLDGISPTHSAIKAELELALHQLLEKKYPPPITLRMELCSLHWCRLQYFLH